MPRSTRSVRFVVAAVLIVAAAVRLAGIGFGLPFPYANPDEHLVTDPALRCLGGEWNPHYFAYPSFCFYLHAFGQFAAFVLMHLPGRGGEWSTLAEFRHAYFIHPSTVLLVSRGLTVAFGVATVWAVGRVAAELAPRGARLVPSLLASEALAFNVLHASQSRNTTVDVPMLFFAALALAHSLRHVRAGATRDLLLAALFGGLAASCKYYGALLALPIGGAAVLRSLRDATAPAHRIATMARRLLLGGGATIAAFLATSPFIVLDWPSFARDFDFLERHMESGHFGHDPTRNGALVYATQLVGNGVGWWLLVPATAGLITLFARRSARGAAASLVAMHCAAHFALIASFKAQPPDYLLALVPGLAAFAGVGIDALARAAAVSFARGSLARAARIYFGAALVLSAPLTIGAAISIDEGRRLAQPDTRVLARRWFEEHVASGTSVASETWLELPLTTQCLQQMLDGRLQAELAEREHRDPPQPIRRGRDESIEQLRAKLAASQQTPPRVAFDFGLLAPLEIDLRDELPPLLKQYGFRWLVLDGVHAARAKRSGAAFTERSAWYDQMMHGAWVAARFDPAADGASGPLLVVIDVDRLPPN